MKKTTIMIVPMIECTAPKFMKVFAVIVELDSEFINQYGHNLDLTFVMRTEELNQTYKKSEGSSVFI